MEYYLGVDIGGTKIAYGLFDEKKNLLKKKTVRSNDSLEGEIYFSQVASDIEAMACEAHIGYEEVKGIGVGIAGSVDFEQGRLVCAASLPKLTNFPVVEYMKERLGFAVNIVMDNDCHCGALAEYRRGAGKQYQHMVYCPISTGISTGIIIDGKLFRGSNGASGESGHMITAVENELRITCGCGNAGCFNSLGSGKAITEHIRRWIRQGESTEMLKLAGSPENITAIHIDEAYKNGDAMAEKAVDQMVKYLSIWLFDVYTLLNINCIVFSGGLLAMGDKLIGRIEKQFLEYKQNDFEVHFYKTELGADSGLIGALELLF